jgi:hypothetical protein
MNLKNIFLIFIIICITACNPNPSEFINGMKCSNPCWQGIMPGKTTLDEAIEIVRGLPEIDKDSISQNKSFRFDGEILGVKLLNSKEYRVELLFINQINVNIVFYFDKNDFSLENVVNKIGEPETVEAIGMRGDPFPFFTALINYPDLGICLYHENNSISFVLWSMLFQFPETYNFKTSLNIRELYMVDPSIPDSQYQYGCLWGSSYPEAGESTRFQAWHGYGDYSFSNLTN